VQPIHTHTVQTHCKNFVFAQGCKSFAFARYRQGNPHGCKPVGFAHHYRYLSNPFGIKTEGFAHSEAFDRYLTVANPEGLHTITCMLQRLCYTRKGLQDMGLQDTRKAKLRYTRLHACKTYSFAHLRSHTSPLGLHYGLQNQRFCM
jgi:hypothetical protein